MRNNVASFPAQFNDFDSNNIGKPSAGGGGGGAVVVHLFSEDGVSFTADKTPQEAWDAMVEGKVVTGVLDEAGQIVPFGTCGIFTPNPPSVCFMISNSVAVYGMVGGDWIMG